MLQRLVIQNFAIIDKLDIEFGKGFHVITGETGAGKSIMIGALDLLLGQRADTKSLKRNDKKCVIEGQFRIENYQLQDFFQENDIDYDPISIIRREISTEGKSRAFVNDTPVNLQTLRQLAEQLVDIHSQHESKELHESNFQIALLDSVSGNRDQVAEYKKAFYQWQQMRHTLNRLLEESQQFKNEMDYIEFQHKELVEANLTQINQPDLEAEQKILSNAGEIIGKLQQVLALFQNENNSVTDLLKTAANQLHGLEKMMAETTPIIERLKSSYVELRDIEAEINGLQDKVAIDPKRLEIIDEKLDSIYRLQQKHRVNSTIELLELQTNLEQKLSRGYEDHDRIEELRTSIKEQEISLFELAEKISANRTAVVSQVEQYLMTNMQALGIPNAQIMIEVNKKSGVLQKNGIDEIRFLFSANKGKAPLEISKVASGGEISRLMLCIKSLLAENEKLPTIIFDEIDTGVSGEVAIKMGQIMRKLSETMQVISITHLPQIASLGEHHFFVYKESGQDQTLTRLRSLAGDDRIVEIAKMLSGDQPTQGAMENAKELLNKN